MTEYTFTYDSGGERYKIIETARTEAEAIRKAEQRVGCEVTAEDARAAYPCRRDCPQRSAECHASCADYRAYEQRNAEERKRKQQWREQQMDWLRLQRRR